MAIKVLIVDDSIVIRKILSDVIGSDPELEVVGKASDGQAGLDAIERLKPDIVTLDVEMPGMDGLETLKALRATHADLPVIMFSTLSTRGGQITLDALALGATDYVTKPANVGSAREAFHQVSTELLPRLKSLGSKGHVRPRRREIKSASTAPASAPVVTAKASGGRVKAVVVGSSTGGPVALDTMLRGIDTALAVPMFVVQHMPPLFTASLAERLDRGCSSRVIEAKDGDIPEPGTVYIAPGGWHMVLRSVHAGSRIELHEGPLVNSCRPAVDELFHSTADVYGRDQLAVMLTGMGYDGRLSSKVLHDLGADVYAQDEETSVVWGMPGAVVADKLACKVLPIEQIGPAIADRCASDATTSRLLAARSRP